MGVISTAVKLHEVEPKDNGYNIHVTAEPDKPEPGTLVDSRGDTLPVKKEGLMARLDTKVGEDVTIKKGTLALIVAGFVLLQVIFNYGGSFIGWTRSDQSQIEKLTQIETLLQTQAASQARTEAKVEAFSERLRIQEIQNAKGEGYKLGQTDAGATGHK